MVYNVEVSFGILGYAVWTSSFGTTFQRGTTAVEGFHLVSFADADYASKATDRRSVSGGGGDMSGGARFMVLADSEMRHAVNHACLLYTSPSPRDLSTSRMPSSA